MDRRLAGVVVLVLALVAVASIPSLTGRRTAGQAVPLTFADPPQVGQCLTSPFPTAARMQSSVPEISVDDAQFGDCVGVVGGEVVSVWARADDVGLGAGRSGRDPCYPSTAEFAGLQSTGRSTDLPGAPASGPVRWRPTIGYDPVRVVPGDVERRAGRDWLVCLAVPTGHASYSGTLRDAFTTGTMPAEFGSCWSGADLDQLPLTVRCDQPHPAELLAMGWIRDRVEAAGSVVDESCSAIAGRIMSTTDPTRGGKLTVVADRLTGGVVSRPDAPLTVACFVTSVDSQQLLGTLIGLADRPVPLVG